MNSMNRLLRICIFAFEILQHIVLMVNSQPTYYNYSVRLICIVMLLLVQFDVLGCVVSNYSRPVTDYVEYTEQGETESDKEEKAKVEETYFRHGSRIVCFTPQVLSVLLPNIITPAIHFIPYVPADIAFTSQQPHALYCVFLI